MKDIIVAKFGGSSLADGSQFKKVRDIVLANEKISYVIPSAPGRRNSQDYKVTDLLYMCQQLASHGINFDEVFSLIEERYQSIYRELDLDFGLGEILQEIRENIRQGYSRDYVASRGEYLNAILLANYLDFDFVDAGELIVFNADGQLNPRLTEKKLRARLAGIDHGVIPGFYGAKENGEIVTFTRGGSDVTGAIIASGVDASLYENWTDVSGFLVADPRIVDKPKAIESISYRELRELSYMGAPVLHEEAIYPIRDQAIPIHIRNTNRPEDRGTLIVDDRTVSAGSITGIAGKNDFTVIGVEKTMMTSEKDFFRKLVSVFETNDISIEHMPSSIDSISVIVPTEEIAPRLDKIKEEIRIYCQPDKIIVQHNMALIAVVGRGMIRSKGVSAKLFTALAASGVNIRMISQGSSELNIIVGVENDDFERAIEAIYGAFI